VELRVVRAAVEFCENLITTIAQIHKTTNNEQFGNMKKTLIECHYDFHIIQ